MTTMVTSKSIFQSKTFWLNIVTFIVAMLTSLMGTDMVQSHPEAVTVFVMILNVLNIILRYLSGKPVTTFGNDIKQIKN